MNVDILQWLLEFIRAQGLGAVIILGAGAFVWKKIWPAVLEQVIPVWQETKRAEVRLFERQVIAVEKIEYWLSLVPAEGVKGRPGPVGDL